jgi:hypothetical protein
MKWYHFWIRSLSGVECQDYLEMPEKVAASPKLMAIEWEAWRARMIGSELTEKSHHKPVRRPPVEWLKDKASSLTEEAKILAEKAARYRDLSDDNGGRRTKTQLHWLAGSVISEQKRVGKERRTVKEKPKGKKS